MVVQRLLQSMHVIVTVVQEADMHQVRLAAADVLMVSRQLPVAPIALPTALATSGAAALPTIGHGAVTVVTLAGLVSRIVSRVVRAGVTSSEVL